jgi:hypothetical protein
MISRRRADHSVAAAGDCFKQRCLLWVIKLSHTDLTLRTSSVKASDARIAPCFRPEGVAQFVRSHETAEQNHGYRLLKLRCSGRSASMPVETAIDRSLADAAGCEKSTPQAKALLQNYRLGNLLILEKWRRWTQDRDRQDQVSLPLLK